jgi:hypothetical protein
MGQWSARQGAKTLEKQVYESSKKREYQYIHLNTKKTNSLLERTGARGPVHLLRRLQRTKTRGTQFRIAVDRLTTMHCFELSSLLAAGPKP